MDPLSGEEVPKDSILNRGDVMRALLASVSACDGLIAREARRALLPQSVGQSWTPEEEAQLTAEFQRGDSLATIAAAHGRTVRGIDSRLERLGLLTAEQRTARAYFEGASKHGP